MTAGSPPPADFRIGGGWGDHISLWKWDEFEKTDLNRHTVKVYGHKTPLPKVGQTVVLECQKSWFKFRIETVEGMRDPPDMFWAELRAIDQVWKP